MIAPDDKKAFALLLDATIAELNVRARQSAEAITLLAGKHIEPYIRDVLAEMALGTPFENSIQLIGGQRFPDIVVGGRYGVEVKTTTQNHWKTTGNSVLESTRVERLERIYMLFAKLADPVEFRCRPYEEVLSEVVVTHSPRYQIDMNLNKKETIFDKINLSYDALRKKENPIRPIIDYYKSQLKPGEDLWWIDQESNNEASNIIITIWSNLSQQRKQEIRNQAMVFFPELFGNSPEKFSRLAIWLATRQAVVCPNVRDLFSAGGKGGITISGSVYADVPRIFITLAENIAGVTDTIARTPASELSEYWSSPTNELYKLNDWTRQVTRYAQKSVNTGHLDIEKLLRDLTS